MTKQNQGDWDFSLQQQADLVCSALDGAPHGFAVVSAEGHVVAANGTLKRWAGEEPGRVSTARAVHQGGPALHGFRLSQRGALLTAVLRAVQGEAVSFETTEIELVPDARGAFRVQVSPWNLGDKRSAACLFVNDVTEEKGNDDRASETSFRQLFDAVPTALLVVRGAVVLYANRAVRQLLGYDWQDELVGRAVPELVRPDVGGMALTDVGAEGTVPVQCIARDGRTVAAHMAKARLVIDDVPTTIIALQSDAGDLAGWRDVVEVSYQALGELVDALDSARRTPNLGDRVRGQLETAELAAQRASEGIRELKAATRASLVPPSDPARSSYPDSDGASARAEPQGTRATVLVCDDEARLAMLTAGLLDQYGYDTVTVATGAEALEALKLGTSDVVLLDMNLPDGSADQVIAQMKDRGYTTPVILTSGYAEEDVDPKLLGDALVSSYLAKPYSVDRLVEAIQNAST